MPLPFWPLSSAWTVRLVVAATLFWLAYDGGTYGLISRTSVAIAVWWAIALALALSLAPVARVPRAALAVGGLLAAFAVWMAASLVWAENDEKALAELTRPLLYLGVFVAVVAASSRRSARAWSDGVAIAIAATGLLALASRMFPAVFPESGLPTFFGANAARLSYPVNYWNGLGILTALGLPLLLGIASGARPLLTRALAVGAMPPLAVVVYLTSSRGATVVALAGAAILLVLGARRWQIAAATATAAVGATAAVAFVRTREALVDAPLSQAADEQGAGAAAVIAVVALAAGAAYAVGARLLSARLHPSRRAGQIAAVAAVLATAVAVVAADPVERFEEFKRDPRQVELQGRGPIERHLVSASGTGRWQQWGTAVDQFQTEPVVGGGAGSHEAWSIQHSTLPEYTTEAHSLYLESLAELGLVGFLLLAAAFALAFGEGARRAWRETEDTVPAAVFAGAAGYAIAAGVDWMWELTVVSVVGMTLFALATGPATAGAVPTTSDSPKHVRRSTRVLLVAAALAVIAVQAVVLLAELSIRRSQSAAREGRLAAAVDAAHAAKAIAPWAPTPYLQLALIREEAGDLEGARMRIREALERDVTDWRLWLVSARIETKLGSVATASRHLARARRLNPRSPAFSAR